MRAREVVLRSVCRVTKSDSRSRSSNGRYSLSGAPSGARVEHVGPERAHAERLHPPRHLAPDAPEPDHAEDLAADVVAEREPGRPFGPLAAAGVGLVREELARERDDERHREVGDGGVEHARGVADRDPALGREGHVEVVVADACPGDDAEVRCGVEECDAGRSGSGDIMTPTASPSAACSSSSVAVGSTCLTSPTASRRARNSASTGAATQIVGRLTSPPGGAPNIEAPCI